MALFLLCTQWLTLSLSSLCLGRAYARWGGLFSFCFSFIVLASKNHFALITFLILSWWFWQNHVQFSCFVDKLAKQNLFSLFLFFLGRPRAYKKHVHFIFFHSSRLQVPICIYIYTYTYTYIHIYLMSNFFLLSLCLAEILGGKRGKK